MKFTCKRSELSETVNNISRAVAQKSENAHLDCAKLYLDGNRLTFSGYDLNLGIIRTIEVESEDHGQVLLNAKLLTDIVRKLPNEKVTAVIDENLKCTITSGNTVYDIPALSADEYPSLPEVEKSDFFEFEQSVMKSMIEQTIYAVAVTDNKPILKGELFDIEDGVFNLVAIDGFRLAIRTEPIKTEDRFNFVVMGKALSELSKLINENSDKKMTVYVSKKHVSFDLGDYTLVARLLEGEFHKYKGSIPKKFNTYATVNTKQLSDVLERCMLIIVEQTKAPARCSFKDGKISVNVSTPMGIFNDELPVEMEGSSLEIGFNSRYLMEALKAAGTDKVKFSLGVPTSPLMITPLDGDQFTFLVLPVRLKN